MCFVLPKQVKRVKSNQAIVEGERIVQTRGIKLNKGDYVLVFADLVVEKITKRQAKYTRKLAKKVVNQL